MIIDKQEIIPRTTLTQMVNTWRQSQQDIRAAYALLFETEKRLKQMFKEESYLFDLGRESYRAHRYEHPDKTLTEIKKDIWRSLIDRMELRRILSKARCAEMDRQIETGEGLPDIDEPSLLAMIENNFNNTNAYIEEAVREVYDWLRPPRSHLKTNSEYEVRKRVIIRCLDWDKWVTRPRICYHSQDNVRGVDNIFHTLDGQGTVKTHRGPLVDAVEAIQHFNVLGETNYFRFRCCRNGNMHLEFKRLDLLQKFNAIAGGMRLAYETKGEPA